MTAPGSDAKASVHADMLSLLVDEERHKESSDLTGRPLMDAAWYSGQYILCNGPTASSNTSDMTLRPSVPLHSLSHVCSRCYDCEEAAFEVRLFAGCSGAVGDCGCS